jgi:type I restriction enzyme S subunit
MLEQQAIDLAIPNCFCSIPKEWKLKKLQDVTLQITDGVHSTPNYIKKGIPFLSVNNLSRDRLDFTGCKYISLEDHNILSKRCKPSKGDVLMGKVATLGVSDVVDTDVDFSIFVQIALLRPNSLINSYFLKYLTELPAFRHYISSISAGTSMKYIGIGDIARLQVPIPVIKEQEKIVQILRTWDEAIAKTEKLITAKQKRKKALAQRFFSQRKLSNSSSGIYKWFQFKEIVESYIDYRGRTPLKIGMQWGEGQIKALSANNVQMGFVNFSKECYLGSEELYKKWMANGDCDRGDILLSTEAPLGNVAQIPDDEKYILSQRVILIKPKVSLIHKDYLFQFMMSNFFQVELQKNSSGSTAVGIQRKRLDKIRIVIPGIEEQKKIASVLYSADIEITKQRQQLKLLKTQKRGLMQKLLTGQWRVTVEEADINPDEVFADVRDKSPGREVIF